jgi:hypothetical protein
VLLAQMGVTVDDLLNAAPARPPDIPCPTFNEYVPCVAASCSSATRQRYETLWRRIRAHLPWVARRRISMHWLRHTTLTWVERTFSPAVARAFAGHSENTGGVTGTYVKATLEEVATALAAWTGEPHPLAVAASDDDPAPV